MSRPPVAALLALAAAVVGLVSATTAVALSPGAGIAMGGVSALVLPYVAAAVALTRRSVSSLAAGSAIVALMTWLSSFAVVEAALGLPRGDPLRPAAATFILLTALGLGATVLGARNFGRAVHATGYWDRTPAPARMALLSAVGWAAIFVADTYLTSSPPLFRMLLAPSLFVLHVGAGLMLRGSRLFPRLAGVMLAVMTGAGTVAYWLVYSAYLPINGAPPDIPDLSYFTQLPWPVLLTLSVAFDLAIAAAGIRSFIVPVPNVPARTGRTAMAAGPRVRFVGTMKIRVERTIAKPFPLLVAALRTGPATWLPGTHAAGVNTAELDVRLGDSRIARAVTVRTGEVATWLGDTRCRMPIAWQAADHPERYPKLSGALVLTERAPRETLLTLMADYDPPAGVVGEIADRAAMHVVAEASVEAFMTRIAGILEREAMSLALAESEPFEHGQ